MTRSADPISKSNRGIVALAGTWCAVVAAGVIAMAKHASTPGRAAGAMNGNLILRVTPIVGRINLLMFLHPRCPCSKASVAELSELMDQFGGRLDVTVFVDQPAEMPADWSRTATVADAGKIPGVTVRFDTNAVMARKYGAQTSGQVFLYDSAGKLRFSGGITGTRGHVGDNAGLDAVMDLVSGKAGSAGPVVGEPVFGCPIYDDENVGKPATNKGRP